MKAFLPLLALLMFAGCSKPPDPLQRIADAQERQAVALERQAKAAEDQTVAVQQQARAVEDSAVAAHQAAKASESAAASLATPPKPANQPQSYQRRQTQAMERSANAAEQQSIDNANAHMFDSLQGWER
jgi:hypothetical protein